MKFPSFEEQYINCLTEIIKNGEWIYNERTGKRCLTIPEWTFKYDLSDETPPVLSIKQCFTVSACAEFLGYLRRYDNAELFAKIGSGTWFQNANETESWLKNEHRKGANDLGTVYGAALEEWELPELYEKLKQHHDDRGLLINFWRPEKFKTAALRPCMYEHIFSIINEDELILNSTQRSVDTPLGLAFNSIQVYFLAKLTAHISGLKAKHATHRCINLHIYEDQLDAVVEMLKRKPMKQTAVFKINEEVDYTKVFETHDHAREFFTIKDYVHQGKVTFPMSA